MPVIPNTPATRPLSLSPSLANHLPTTHLSLASYTHTHPRSLSCRPFACHSLATSHLLSCYLSDHLPATYQPLAGHTLSPVSLTHSLGAHSPSRRPLACRSQATSRPLSLSSVIPHSIVWMPLPAWHSTLMTPATCRPHTLSSLSHSLILSAATCLPLTSHSPASLSLLP